MWASHSEWIVLLLEQTEHLKSRQYLLKTVEKRCFKLLFDCLDSVGDIPIGQVIQKPLHLTWLLLLRMLGGTPGFLPDLAWTSLSPSLFTQCGINAAVSWHGCHRDRQGGQALVFTKHTSFFVSGSILSKCSRSKAEMQSKECTVWYKYTSLWCWPTPPIFCSHPPLEHYLLVDFMEFTRKSDKISTFSAIARWRLEIALIRLELFRPVLRSINMSTQPDWGFQHEENTPGQHLFQIASEKDVVLRVYRKIP